MTSIMLAQKLVAVATTDSFVKKIDNLEIIDNNKQFRYVLPRYSDVMRNIRVNLFDKYNCIKNEKYIDQVWLIHSGQIIIKNLHEYTNIIPLICFNGDVNIVVILKNVDENLMNCSIHTSYDMIFCNPQYRKNLAQNGFIMDEKNNIKIINGRLSKN